MMPTSDDLMDLGPFMKEYVLGNPFSMSKREPQNTMPTILGPSHLESETPSPPVSPVSGAPSSPQAPEKLPRARGIEKEDVETRNIVESVLSDESIDNRRGHFGSNTGYAAMLRQSTPLRYMELSHWLKASYTFDASRTEQISVDDLLRHVNVLFPEIKKSVLSRAMRYIFPECKKVLNRRTNYYVGLLERDTATDEKSVESRQSPRTRRKWKYHQYQPERPPRKRRRMTVPETQPLEASSDTEIEDLNYMSTGRSKRVSSQDQCVSDESIIPTSAVGFIDIKPKVDLLATTAEAGAIHPDDIRTTILTPGSEHISSNESTHESPTSIPVIVKSETVSSGFEENLEPEDLSMSKSVTVPNGDSEAHTPVLRSMLNTNGKHINSVLDVLVTKTDLEETKRQLQMKTEKLDVALSNLDESKADVCRLNMELHQRDKELHELAEHVFDLSHQVMKVTDMLKKAISRPRHTAPL